MRVLTKIAVKTCVGSYILTRYFSRGSVSNASPNIDRQYSAILACCFGLGVTAQQQQKKHILWFAPINTVDNDTAWTSDLKMTYESTWFSNDRMMGKGEVLKAHSAIASITSYKSRSRKEKDLGIEREIMLNTHT